MSSSSRAAVVAACGGAPEAFVAAGADAAAVPSGEVAAVAVGLPGLGEAGDGPM